MNALRILAGPAAQQWIQQHGVQAQHVAAIPGAAGGPKGLVLQGLDHFLFGDWLSPQALEQRQTQQSPALQLVGASIGAWRMAAASSPQPVQAFQRLADQYCEAQKYPKGVQRTQITAVCNAMVQALLAQEAEPMTQAPGKQLLVWVNKGKRPLHTHNHAPRPSGFASAVVSNAFNRNNLARYFERWVFYTGPQSPQWLTQPYDRIPARFAQLGPHNLHQALLASGSIPFVLDAVPHIEHHKHSTPHQGPFWDGGLTDYHLALPYHRLQGLVLYPHFSHQITPGWLDKFLKLRKANPSWLSNVVLLCPSAEWVASLPAKKIPDRSDFKRYGLNHAQRIAHWRQAIAESHRLADEWAAFVHKPDLSRVEAL